jgi:hypothetical protein
MVQKIFESVKNRVSISLDMEHFVRIRDRILGADWSVTLPTTAFHSEITRAGSVLLGSGEQTRGRTAPSKTQNTQPCTHYEKKFSFREMYSHLSWVSAAAARPLTR